MVGEVRWINFYGPNCSYRGYPRVRLIGSHGEPLSTQQSRSTELNEAEFVLDPNPDGLITGEGSTAHFLIFTSQLDPSGNPCPPGHMVDAFGITVELPNIGTFEVDNKPLEGPKLSSCDGSIAVTSAAHLQ
jgi:hypothetical protein